MPLTAQEEPSLLTALGYLALGAGFFVTGIQMLRARGRQRLTGVRGGSPGAGAGAGSSVTVPGRLVSVRDTRAGSGGRETLGESLARTTGGARPKVTTHTVYTIDQRVALIRRLVEKGARDNDVRDIALGVVTRKCGEEWCVPPKDAKAEAAALYRAITDPKSPYAVRYTKEHEKVDVFQSARQTLRLKGGDCDDQVALLGSLLKSVGHDPRLVVMQATGAKDWSHILLADVLPSGGAGDGVFVARASKWYFLDPTMPQHGPGWSPPGLVECLKTGRPSGIAVRCRAYKVG